MKRKNTLIQKDMKENMLGLEEGQIGKYTYQDEEDFTLRGTLGIFEAVVDSLRLQ